MRMYAEKNLEALTSVVSTNEVREEVNANKDKKVVLNFQSAEAIHEDCKNERDKAITEFEKRFLPDWNNSFKQKEGYKKILFYIFCSLLFLVIISIIALGFVAAFTKIDTYGLIGIITALISLVTAILTVLRVMTTSLFGKDDEKIVANIIEKLIDKDNDN